MNPSLQVVTSVPTAKLPLGFSIGRKTTTKELQGENARFEDEADAYDDVGRRGQILWIRGLTRLQHQVHFLTTSTSINPLLSHLFYVFFFV